MAIELQLTACDDTSCTLKVTGLNSSYITTKVDILLLLSGNNYLVVTSETYNSYISSCSITVTGLTTGVPYPFCARQYYTVNGSEQFETSSYLEVVPGGTPIDPDQPGGGEDEYKLYSYTVDDIETVSAINVNVGTWETIRYKFIPAENETITFWTEDADSNGNRGVRFVVSTSTAINKNGIPDDWLVHEGQYKGNLSIDCDVTAGVTYYLYVQCCLPDDTLNCAIYIGVNGGSGAEPPTKWTVTSVAISNISSAKSYELGFTQGKVIRYNLTFSSSGNVTFYTTGNIDVIAYFAEASQYSLDFNTADGSPGEWDYYNDDISSSDRNFSITAPVVRGTTYYLYVRGINLETSGTCMLYIEPEGSTSWKVVSDVWGSTDSSRVMVLSIAQRTVYQYSMTFTSSGTATFYTEGNVDTYGYLTTTTEFNAETGAPTSIRASDDSSGDGDNFKIEYNVSAGTKYYLWVRGYFESTSGSVTVVVTPPEKVDPAGSAVLTSVSTTVRSVTLKVTGLDTNYSKSDRVIRWYYGLTEYNATKYGESNLSAGVSESNEYTITGLDANTPYYFYAIIIFGDSSKQLETITVTTDPWHTWNYGDLGILTTEKSQAMNLGMGEVGYVTVTFQYSGTATFYTSGYTDTIGVISESYSFNRTTGWPNTYIGSPVDGGIDDSYSNFKFTRDVTAGITYYVWVRYYFGNLSCNTTLYIDPPKKQLNKPTAFSWDTPKIQGQAFNITAVEWNKLQTKVNEAREYQADKSGSSIPTYGFTAVSSGQSFTAEAYNAVLMGIAGALSILGSSGIYDANEVHTGDLVTAAKINRLVTLVNELIDT